MKKTPTNKNAQPKKKKARKYYSVEIIKSII